MSKNAPLWSKSYPRMADPTKLKTTAAQKELPHPAAPFGVPTSESASKPPTEELNNCYWWCSLQQEAPFVPLHTTNKFSLSLENSSSVASITSSPSTGQLSARRDSDSSIGSVSTTSKTVDHIIEAKSSSSTTTPLKRRHSLGLGGTPNRSVVAVVMTQSSPASDPLPAGKQRTHKSQGSQDFASTSSANSSPTKERIHFPGTPSSGSPSDNENRTLDLNIV